MVDYYLLASLWDEICNHIITLPVCYVVGLYKMPILTSPALELNFILVCGEKKVSATPLIVNGKQVQKGNYPWTTAIFRRNDTEPFLNVCGGSMLTQRVILTGHPNSPIDDRVGKYYNKFKDSRDTEAQYSEIEQILIPTKYKGDYQHYANDIALLITKDELLLSKVVQSVCFTNLLNINLEVNQMGWLQDGVTL
ncbi:hypothetical protein NQ317_009831 [Molorchus minor]|uniref:Peptidase S1 domain-containing protein n=1 Tax=Molorchus minor TaxID=1323400 RepID=A0ABQ9JTI0_9CUCU|nr:hypothetical protein NQ317_009831 [Molorchus minor]